MLFVYSLRFYLRPLAAFVVNFDIPRQIPFHTSTQFLIQLFNNSSETLSNITYFSHLCNLFKNSLRFDDEAIDVYYSTSMLWLVSFHHCLTIISHYSWYALQSMLCVLVHMPSTLTISPLKSECSKKEDFSSLHSLFLILKVINSVIKESCHISLVSSLRAVLTSFILSVLVHICVFSKVINNFVSFLVLFISMLKWLSSIKTNSVSSILCFLQSKLNNALYFIYF